MARIRTTKPEFYLDPDVQSLSLQARFLFQAMWCQADDRGRLLDHPALICAQAFAPTDKVKPEALLAELAAGREPRILRYEAKGKRLIAVRWFRFHQVPSKPQESRLPAPNPHPENEPFQGWTRDEYAARSGSVPVVGPEQDPDDPTPEVELGSGSGTGDWNGSGSEVPDEAHWLATKYLDKLRSATPRLFASFGETEAFEIAAEFGIDRLAAARMLGDVWEWWRTAPPSRRWKSSAAKGWRNWCRTEMQRREERAAANGSASSPALPPEPTCPECEMPLSIGHMADCPTLAKASA